MRQILVIMSKVVYLDPIDYISGKIARRFRTIYCHRTDSDRRYTTVRSTRKTPLTDNELVARELFRARARWVKQRKEDLSKVTQDQAAFIAQKNLPGGAKTMLSYYWKLAKAEIDENSLNG